MWTERKRPRALNCWRVASSPQPTRTYNIVRSEHIPKYILFIPLLWLVQFQFYCALGHVWDYLFGKAKMAQRCIETAKYQNRLEYDNLIFSANRDVFVNVVDVHCADTLLGVVQQKCMYTIEESMNKMNNNGPSHRLFCGVKLICYSTVVYYLTNNGSPGFDGVVCNRKE